MWPRDAEIRPGRLNTAYAAVPAAFAAVVAPALSYPEVRFTPGPGPVLGTVARASLGAVDGGEYVFPAKLWGAVAIRLGQAGYRPRVMWPYVPPGWRDLPPVPPAAGPAAGVLNARAGRLGGLFRPGCGVTPERVIPPLLRRYAGLRAVLAARTLAEADRWTDLLRRSRLPQRVGDVRVVAPETPDPKVLVVTLRGLELCRPGDFDVAVVPDAGPLAGSGPPPRRPGPDDPWLAPTTYDVLWAWDVPAYGVLPPGREPGGGDRLRLLGMFGQMFPAAGPQSAAAAGS